MRLQTVGQVKGWKVQQIVFVGGTCARRTIEEQDKMLRSYFAQKGWTRGKGGDLGSCKAREHVRFNICVIKE